MSNAMELLSTEVCDDILNVDLESRKIVIPDTVLNLGVESDDSVRVLHFQVPRYYCEVDLSTFVIRINYKHASGAGGYYDISTPTVEENLIKFDWKVARQVVVKKGNVLFNVCLREIVGDSVEREFNTTIAMLPVLEGLETGEELAKEHIDVFEQMLREFSNGEWGGVSIPNGAKVGQIIQVTKVDESGKPTEWKAVDMPSVGGLEAYVDGETLYLTGYVAPPEDAVYGEIDVDETAVEVNEATPASFLVSLASAPNTTQTVKLTPSDNTKISVSPSVLTFTADNWNVTKLVTVSAPAGSTESEQTITLSSTGVSDVKVAVSVKAASPFMEVNWLDTVYTVGQNSHLYNAWCPDTVAYDETRNLIVFQQNHRNGNHSSAMVAKTLCTIDPYDPTVYTDVSAYPGMSSASEGVGGLIVENGVWTTYCKTQRRRSTDGGATWQTDAVVTPPARMYGVFKVDDVLYCGDDYSTTDTSHNGWYYVSYDDGLNWEQKVFDFADDYEIQCSEARFCQWKGKLYATLRREANTGLLARLDDSGWVVIYDQLPNVTSDSSLLAFDGLLAISSVDRPNQKLILSTWDGSALTVAKEYDFTGINRSGDFHTPTYIHGPDFQAVFFMTYGMYSSEYQSCMNAAVFGYKDGVEANTPTYEVETYTYSWQDVLSSPPSYNCTVNVSDNGVCIVCEDTRKPALGALSKRWPWCYPPDENGHAYIYSFIDAVTWPTYITDGRYGKVLCDTKQIGDRTYICVTKAMQNIVPSGIVPVKIMGIANKITLEDSDMTGAAYCGSFHSFLTTENSYVKTTGTAYGVVQD